MRIIADTVELVYRPQKMKPIERALLWTMALLLLAVVAYTVRWEMFDSEHVRRVIDTALEHPLSLLPVPLMSLCHSLFPRRCDARAFAWTRPACG